MRSKNNSTIGETMKSAALWIATLAFAVGCKEKTGKYSPQEILEYHSNQPEQPSATLVENALKSGAKLDQFNTNGLLPWLAAAKGVDDNRAYPGSAKSPDELKLSDGSNNPAESNSEVYQNASISVLKLFIEHGADKSVTDSLGENALHLAAIQGRELVVEYLVSIGVDINAQDSAGYTPLMRAISAKSPRTIERLLARGARVDAMSKYGQSAEVLAQESGDTIIAELIAKAASTK